jgi:hypothetical protein
MVDAVLDSVLPLRCYRMRIDLLLPSSSLDSLELLSGHSMPRSEISCHYQSVLDIFAAKWLSDRPAVIFASISTLESAGIQDSGNSTLS